MLLFEYCDEFPSYNYIKGFVQTNKM